MLVAALLGVFVVGSWFPFVLDLPQRSQDVVVDASGDWRFSGSALATSGRAPAWLSEAIEGSELEISLEVRTAASNQTGPARILAVSQGTDSHNLVIGQEGPDLVIRVRRSGTNEQGQPPMLVPNVFDEPAWRSIDLHVGGDVELRVDDSVAASLSGRDTFASWDRSQVLALGNEPGWGRGWEGTIRRAEVRTGGGETDLLASGLTREWDGRWVWPRLSEAPERPLGQRMVVWVMHFLVAVCLLTAATRAWPGRSSPETLRVWVLLVILVNGGKLLVGGRHPSLLTALVQVAGGVVGVWLAGRVTLGVPRKGRTAS